MRRLAALITIPWIACAVPETSICDEAEELAIECGEAAAGIDFGECSGAVEEAAAEIVEGGCEGLKAAKSDAFSQLCIGPLKKFFPWCQADDYRCEPSTADLDPSLCNGSAALCDRPYDEVVFATSHNAYSAATMGFIRPNQSKRMYVQLRDGMRGLMVDSRLDDGELAMCHVDCALGSTPFVEGLVEIRDFLECHPNEVVTLIIEPHAESSMHVAAIREAGLESFAFTHVAGEPWPTLGEMISMDKRLVVLVEEPGVDAPGWYHHQWDVGFDNEFSVKKVEDFACELERGQPENSLFGLNHFITNLGGDELFATKANQAQSIREHVADCEETFGRLPTFLAVDFHDIGDTVEVVAELNGE